MTRSPWGGLRYSCLRACWSESPRVWRAVTAEIDVELVFRHLSVLCITVLFTASHHLWVLCISGHLQALPRKMRAPQKSLVMGSNDLGSTRFQRWDLPWLDRWIISCSVSQNKTKGKRQNSFFNEELLNNIIHKRCWSIIDFQGCWWPHVPILCSEFLFLYEVSVVFPIHTHTIMSI